MARCAPPTACATPSPPTGTRRSTGRGRAPSSLWQFRLPLATHTAQDNWTFVTPDFLPKPVYLEVQKALRPPKDGAP